MQSVGIWEDISIFILFPRNTHLALLQGAVLDHMDICSHWLQEPSMAGIRVHFSSTVIPELIHL